MTDLSGNERFDIVVIGAGIAGVSAAAELSRSARVLLVEMESQPGTHATGRSAAYFAASYGSATVRAITRAGEQFYRQPPADFCEVELLHPRTALFVARTDQIGHLQELHGEIPELQSLSTSQVVARVPAIEARYVAAGLLDREGGDLDVDAIMQGYLRLFRSRGGQLSCNSPVRNLQLSSGLWKLELHDGEVQTPIVVNAAGAWAGKLGELAGLNSLSLQPRKRTALLIKPPEQFEIGDWPLVIDVEEKFYFKPDAGLLLVSPADETPSDACDAHADELDLAIAVDRLEQATSIRIKRIEHKWAGLRTFAPDREFVVGFDPRTTGFFWLAGQGGYGVQSAPGLSLLTDAMITGASLPAYARNLFDHREVIHPERLLSN